MPVMQAFSIAVLLLVLLEASSAQTAIRGLYPPVTELSKFRSVTASSTCGLNNVQMSYCMSSTNNASLTTCTELTCLLNCCSTCGRTKPTSLDILSGTLNSVTQSSDVRAGSAAGSRSSVFGAGSYVEYRNLAASNMQLRGFSFSAWVKQQSANIGYEYKFFIAL